MEAAITAIAAKDVDIVLVAGDLTKDGEKQCYEKVAAYFTELEDEGKRVFVVPGNHDISNPHSYSFTNGSSPVLVSTVIPEEFAPIYEDFGNGEALYRDPISLSLLKRSRMIFGYSAWTAANTMIDFPISAKQLDVNLRRRRIG